MVHDALVTAVFVLPFGALDCRVAAACPDAVPTAIAAIAASDAHARIDAITTAASHARGTSHHAHATAARGARAVSTAAAGVVHTTRVRSAGLIASVSVVGRRGVVVAGIIAGSWGAAVVRGSW